MSASRTPGLDARVSDPQCEFEALATERGRALWEVLPSLVHDLRGPVTATTVFCQLVETDLDARELPSRAHLDAIRANAEYLAHLADGLGLLAQGARGALAPLGEVSLEAAGRWQKVLSRSGMALNLSGEFPDTPVERRALRVALASLMLLVAKAAEGGGPTELTLSVSQAAGVISVTLDVEPQAESSVAARRLRLTETWEQASRETEFSGLVLRAALQGLDATVQVVRATESGGTLVLHLGTNAGGDI